MTASSNDRRRIEAHESLGRTEERLASMIEQDGLATDANAYRLGVIRNAVIMDYDSGSEASHESRWDSTTMKFVLDCLAAVDRENEWRGLFIRATNAFGGFRPEMDGYGKLWLVPKNGSDNSICIGDYCGGELPSRPSDDVVAKIRSAING